MKLLFYIFPLLFYVSDTYSHKHCHSAVSDIRNYLGSKSPYRFIINFNYRLFEFEGCQREKIIGFVRHGTRTPGFRIIMRMKMDLPKMRDYFMSNLALKIGPGLLCDSTIKDLLSWEFKLDPSEKEGEKLLTKEGVAEMAGLAIRLQDIFPDLLPQYYTEAAYLFKFTLSKRAASSAKYFVGGLLGDGYHNLSSMFPLPEEKSYVLRFYKYCPKWVQTVKESSHALDKYWDFIFGDEVTKLCESVSKRFGLDVVLSYEDIQLLYETCRYETAYHHQYSPWCAIFNEQDFETLQYAEDLKHYWRDGYGYKLNYEIACPAIKHIFDYLKSDAKGNATATFYFSHSGTILKLLSHLGLYEDPFKLTETLTKDLRDGRLFRTSYIDTFGSNLIFVSYKCGDEKKILTLHQEKPVQIPGCPEEDLLCPLSFLLDKFEDSINNCNFDEICSLPPAPTQFTANMW